MIEDVNVNDNKQDSDLSNKEVRVKDSVAVLKEFSYILALATSQNSSLSIAISKLANIISRYKDKPLDDVINNLTLGRRSSSIKNELKPQKIISELEARSLTVEQIEKLLASGNLSKSDLATIALVRFGISRAEVKKTKKEVKYTNL